MIDFKSPPQGSYYCVMVILSFCLKKSYDWSLVCCEFKLLRDKHSFENYIYFWKNTNTDNLPEV